MNLPYGSVKATIVYNNKWLINYLAYIQSSDEYRNSELDNWFNMSDTKYSISVKILLKLLLKTDCVWCEKLTYHIG